jgi:small subunit ribosomal protein S7
MVEKEKKEKLEDKAKEETKEKTHKESKKIEIKETEKRQEHKINSKKEHYSKETSHKEHETEYKKHDFGNKTHEQNDKGKSVFVKKHSPFSHYKLFNKWSTKDVIVKDLSLVNYINLEPVIIPHSFGRKTRGRFSKAEVNIVERLINKAMRSGQGKRKLSGKFIRGRKGCGKKLQLMQIVEEAFEIIEKQTKKNPVQALIEAIENSAPREDVTRIKKGGVAYSIAVDVSPLKRLDEAIKNIALAGFGNSFNTKRDAATALAEEIISASKNDNKSIAIKRRDEVERVAKASR